MEWSITRQRNRPFLNRGSPAMAPHVRKRNISPIGLILHPRARIFLSK
jgi:hypothetical protein